MMGWAGLRNVLAHHDGSVDLGRIADTLATELAQLEQFAAAAATWNGSRPAVTSRAVRGS